MATKKHFCDTINPQRRCCWAAAKKEFALWYACRPLASTGETTTKASRARRVAQPARRDHDGERIPRRRKTMSKSSNKIHLFPRHCWNCDVWIHWGRLCQDCVRAMLISGFTFIGATIAGWYWKS